MWDSLSKASTLTGLLGLSILQLFSNEIIRWLSFFAFIAFLAFLSYRFYTATKEHSQKIYPNGCKPISCFVRYVTSDGNHITYELFRHVQIKIPYLAEFPHEFEWTGSKPPIIKSDLQKVMPVEEIPGKKTKRLPLKFTTPKVYNDVEVIHSKMELDDSDKKSQTMLRHWVKTPITLICFRVELLNCDASYFGKRAKVTRTKAETSSAIEEDLGFIAFDSNTKAFFHQIHHPEPGYHYKLEWDRHC